MHLSRRALAIPSSMTLGLDAQVAALKAQGIDVISLAAGQPDFAGPPEATEAALRFLAECGGKVRYTPSSGIPELREAAAAQLRAVTGAPFEASQVVVTCGAKEAIHLAIAALCDVGDEVVVPTPAWLSYEPMVLLASARARFATTGASSGYKLTPDALAAALNERTRAVILNTPSNPTGAVYTRAELEALAEVLAPTEVAVISDEIYWPFTYGDEHAGAFVSPASLPGLAGRTAVISGVSKTYSMTGWRVGWVAAPTDLTRVIASIKSHTTSNASATAQHASLGALRAGDAHPRMMRDAFARRRALALQALGAMPGVSVEPPAGAFYIFPRVDAFYGAPDARIHDSVSFCRALLDDARVAAVPGAAFQEDRCVRLSYAMSDDQLTEALRRMADFLAALQPVARGASA
jgi:aspartate aminotransferase